ncbi:hypothetical protein CGLO_13763 [Colletotrichum gloeosporioides Cg-14]|uniref:Uncharacterized protein n=1 Tax=Colletotrichum gloeosporioides (strain Cg-14) TaxID=1237896 RepID=T0K5E7_COLGC|nr:hypothetical protein CGLO_13763 [Colletotrichum gloeosporioides Cg-14]
MTNHRPMLRNSSWKSNHKYVHLRNSTTGAEI